jgi:hypothetical protein
MQKKITKFYLEELKEQFYVDIWAYRYQKIPEDNSICKQILILEML